MRRFSTSSRRLSRRPAQKNPYEVLGVGRTATKAQIKSRFYELSKQHHPDRTRSLSEAQQVEHKQKFQQIQEAYSTLIDPIKRAAVPEHSSDSPTNTPYRDPYGPNRDARRQPPRRSGFYRKSSTGGYSSSTQDNNDFHTKHHQYQTGASTNPNINPLHGRFSKSSNYDVPHFDYDKHLEQQEGYDKHREAKRQTKQPQGQGSEPHQSTSRTFPIVTTTVITLSALLLYSFYT